MGLAVVALLASALSAAPEKGSEPPLVVRLGVDLVQIDAVVTDKKGRPVTDLVAADFEVLQDGRPQAVTQAAYMLSAAAAGAPGPARPLRVSGERRRPRTSRRKRWSSWSTTSPCP